LTSALKEVAELKRLEELNELYSHGVRQMDAGNWYEARKLLEQVHKMQTGFLETERLLRKVEDEIRKIEELQQRNIQINTLYEQAHGLLRSKNWREALEKIEEIQSLDSRFEDKDGITAKAKAALELEEQEIQRQNLLAALYAEALRLLREGKFQEALDKLQEIKAIDPKYPDRQSVQRIAHKKLAARRPRIANLQQLGIISFLIVTLVGIVWLSSQAFDVPNNVLTDNISNAFLLSEYYWHFSNDSKVES
jgi:outer membrane protein assembly factor BamD (BamD/ComL family)